MEEHPAREIRDDRQQEARREGRQVPASSPARPGGAGEPDQGDDHGSEEGAESERAGLRSQPEIEVVRLASWARTLIPIWSEYWR